MKAIGRATLVAVTLNAAIGATVGHAEMSSAPTKHCGLNAGTAPEVKMWEAQPPSQRKTTRELIIAIVLAHQRYLSCKENGLTVILRMAEHRRVETVYLIKD